jgi:hypothetical protein
MLVANSQSVLRGLPETQSLKKQEELRLKIIMEILIEFIYYSPFLFDCRGFQEDEKSGFLFAVYRTLPKLIENYDGSRGKFVTYLVTYVRLIAKGCRRMTAKTRAAEDSVEYCYGSDYAGEFEAREEEPVYTAEPRVQTREKELRGRFPKTVEKTLLVLALKSSYSITERQISFVAGITGFDCGKLRDIVESARSGLRQREEERGKLTEGRNHAFVQKTRCRIELERLAPESSQYALVQKQYNFYSAVLERKNEQLKTKFKLIPSNKYIGDALDIPARNVKRILDDAERTFRSAGRRLVSGDYVS